MDISLFRRGIQLERSGRTGAPELLATPEQIVMQLEHQAGGDCDPVVHKGESCLKGQLVARSPDSMICVHSPVSGTVGDVNAKVRTPDGGWMRGMVIESDGKARNSQIPSETRPRTSDWQATLKWIAEFGIVLRGRQPRSLARILNESLLPTGHIAATGDVLARPIEHLVVRCTDRDPSLEAMSCLAETMTDTSFMEAGIQFLTELCGINQVHIVVDRSKSYPHLLKLCDQNDYALIKGDPRHYPSMSDALLGKAASGREPVITFRGVHESGILVLDLDAVLELGTGVKTGEPVTQKIITVSGPRGSKLIKAHVGTTMEAILRCAGIEPHEGGKVLCGGLMTGLAHYSLDFPVSKDIEGVFYLRPDQVSWDRNEMCIGCGLCTRSCPMRLQPGLLSRYCEFNKRIQAEQAHLFTCIECGCCAYVCPARRSMVQLMIQAKSEILASRKA